MASRLIGVALHAADPITKAGLLGHIKREPTLTIATEVAGNADVVVMVVDEADAAEMHMLRRLSVPGRRILLIIGRRWLVDLRSLIEQGAEALKRDSEFTPRRFTDAIRAIGQGCGDPSPVLKGALLDRLQRVIREVLDARIATASDLHERDLQVLQLLAEGCTLEEVGRQLCYSERTVKSILQRVMKQLNARNRTQAVSDAIRRGLI